MHLLITRPGDDGARLADTLRQLGHDPALEPLLTIRLFDGPPLDLSGVQAILATSANGIRAIAGRTDERQILLYAVGDATARAAKEAGFLEVSSASGDVEALAALAREKLDPAKGPLVHVAGSEVAGDLAGALGAAGFTVRREVLYESETAYSLSASTIAAIKEERIDGILVYSPRTAATLSRLIRKARLVRDCRHIDLFCLSPAVAEAAKDIQWRETKIAAEPTQEAMLALVRSPTRSPAEAAAPESPADPQNGPPVLPPKSAHTGRTVMITLGTVVVLAGVAWATQSTWRPPLSRYIPALAMDDPAARLMALDHRLAQLESQVRAGTGATPTESPTAQAERDRLQARLDKVEAALDAMRGTVAQGTASGDDTAAREALRQVGERLNSVATDTAVRIDRIARQVDAIEQTVPTREDADAVRNARLVFAIGRLRDAVLSTHAFRIELAALKSLAGDDAGLLQAIDRLAPYADSGVPTADILRQRFRRLAPVLVNAAREPVAGDSWIDSALARVMSAINIRRTDAVEGGDAEAVVARAEKALDRNDVKQAAGELATLSERAASVAKPWLGEADAYLAASTALVDLQTRAFAALGTPGAK